MLLRPTISLSRLLVTKSGKRVYDQVFHLGLNIIRGENGSGKTTIADFIFFALGGDTPQWRAEASICDYVFAEVNINGQPATLRRQVEQEKFRPMAIFWGSIEQSDKMQTEWQLYPYAASAAKESFSQAMFRAVGIPEVQGGSSAKITMHQILRLLYVDQKTDYEQLFRSEPFDSQVTREAVGDLLCGVYDARLYEAEFSVGQKETEKNRLQGELKAIFSILGATGIPDPAWLNEEKAKYVKEREDAYAELKALQVQHVPSTSDLDKRRAELASVLAKHNETVRELETHLVETQTETADRDQFLNALRKRLQALDESQGVHDALGTFSFKFCPACYAPLSTDGNVCHLCKGPVDAGKSQNLLALRREIEQQISESQRMQQTAEERRKQLTQELSPTRNRQRALQLQYDEIAAAALPSIAVALAEKHRRIGYLDRTIEELERRSQLAVRVAAISTQQAELSSDISKLTDEIAARRSAQQELKAEVYALIANSTLEALKRDLPREAAFTSAGHIDFDFAGNHISVDGRRTFAASSNVYLKNAFHLALCQVSFMREYLRYPRLAIFDNVEDKGMESARSHNFQKIVREVSDSTEVDHQIILFTSMIEPTFEKEPSILVGPYYTHERRTLDIGAVAGSSLTLPDQ